MARTGAERQAAYRARQAEQHSGQRRLSTWISADAAAALQALADRYGVTMRDALEQILLRECESAAKPKKNKSFPPLEQTPGRYPLPRNDSAPAATSAIDAQPVAVLPSNEGVDVAGTPAPAGDATAEPARGEQYSLAL